MNAFEKNYQSQTTGCYQIWDRIVLRGYIGSLQRENVLVYFLQAICGITTITSEALKSFTQKFVASVEKYALDHNIPVEIAPKGERKHEYALQYAEKFGCSEGVFLILKSVESANTFTSYQPKRKTRNPHYRKITRGNKQVNYYYFYLTDPAWGVACIRICSYLPFNVTLYLNGHNYLRKQLEKSGLAFTQDGNCYLEFEDYQQAQALCDKLNTASIQSFGDRWLSQLMTIFTPEQKRKMSLSYRYSVSQIEYSHNLIFKEGVALNQLFERLSDQNRRIGRPATISMIFDKRITARYNGKLRTTLDTRNNVIPIIKSWYKKSFIKQYAKLNRVLRTEICLNDPYDLGIGRDLSNLAKIWQKLQQVTNRYLDALDTILLSFVDRGIAFALAETTVVGNRRIPGIKLDHRRLMAVLEAVEQYSNLVDGFTNQTLRKQVAQLLGIPVAEYSPAQMQYDLSKLRAKGLVEKMPRQNTYVLTCVGFPICVLITKLRRFILEPLLNGITKLQNTVHQEATNLLDQSYLALDQALLNLFEVTGIKFA